MKEPQKILEELIGSKPEQLTGEAKRLFEAIMKIADERDELLKERQADKEKIKELEEEIDDWKFTKKYVEDNYIHKNEIKKEIEELGNMKVSGDVFITSVNFAIKILQKLLKDGGE